jgi:hypothetical protein
VAYLVVVIEQAQCRSTVLVPVDAHHRFGCCGERVFQERLPGFILASIGAPLGIKCFILKNQHWPFASEKVVIIKKKSHFLLQGIIR